MSEQNGDLHNTLVWFWRVVVSRRWWILLSAFVASLGAAYVSTRIPDQFRSEATILFAKSSVSQQYVVPTNTANTMEAVDAIKREVLSRSRLEQLINQFGLYPNSRQLGSTALTELMRSDIESLPLGKDPERRPMSAFIIAFTANNPNTAQQVTDRLANLFIDENLRRQRQLATSTNDFLQQQVQLAKVELDRQEALVRGYTAQHLGDLPEQTAGNLEVLNGLQIQLQAAEANLARARQQRAYLEAMLTHYLPGMEGKGEAGANADTSRPPARELLRLRRQRDELLSRYEPAHPDVVAINEQIAILEAQPGSTPPTSVSSNSSFADSSDPAFVQLRSQLEANRVEAEDAQRQMKRLQAEIAQYQGRLSLAPLRERQFQEYQRDYELAKENYTSLLGKQSQSDLAAKLEVQQGGERFQIIDPASLPVKPVGPHRMKIALAGLGLGLGLGLVLAFVLESHYQPFRCERDVRAVLPSVFVTGVPALHTAAERRKRALLLRVQWAMAVMMLLSITASQLFVYFRK